MILGAMNNIFHIFMVLYNCKDVEMPIEDICLVQRGTKRYNAVTVKLLPTMQRSVFYNNIFTGMDN